METFQQILRGAVQAGASDIHIKPGAAVMFRIRRDLCPVDAPVPTAEWTAAIVNEITPAHLRESLAERREADFAYELPGAARFRVNVFQQRGDLVLAMRVVRSTIRGFAELHLPDAIRKIADSPRGIILLAGAPGSGKSTTLAAIMEHLNTTVRKHIITLEDPIEYTFDDKNCVFEQREVGIDTLSFASGLRHVLRQDPDVLVIGEMREPDSVATAVSAANVGVVVISTLHTNDAARSVQRILEFFPGEDREHARRQLASTLGAVICQKLVRALDGSVLPALEILINTSGVAKLIETDRLDQLSGAIELGSGDGMQTFEQALHTMVKQKRISEAEALAHAPNKEALKMRLQGLVLSDSRRILGSRD